MYTKVELQYAIGHEIEYIIKPTNWRNWSPQQEVSIGILKEVIMSGFTSGFLARIAVWDIKRNGMVYGYASDVKKVPVIDRIKGKKLWQLIL
jgi:hypothetical protein